MSPRLRVHLASNPIVVGGEVRGGLEIEVDRELAVRHISIALVGQARLGGSWSPFLRSRAVLTGRARLPAGLHRLTFRLDVPRNMPPSVPGESLAIDYSLEVHVDIPWWPDTLERFQLWVVLPPEPDFPLEPYRARLAAETVDDAPAIELSLASRTFGVFDEVRGAVALSVEEASRSRGVEVRLVGRLVARHRGHAILVPLEGKVPLRGRVGEFVLRMPWVAASFETPDFSLFWSVEVESLRRLGRGPGGAVPVWVLADPRGRLPEAVPALGPLWQGERLRALASQLLLVVEGDTLVGRVGEARVEIVSDGDDLLGRLRFPSFELELALGRRARLRARFPSLARVVGAALRPADLPPGGEWVSLDDTHLCLRAPFSQAAPLGRWLTEAAGRLSAVRATLLPPGGLAPRLGSWRLLASSLECRLEPGPLVVRGGHGGFAVRVAVVWEGEAAHATEIALGLGGAPVRGPDDPEVAQARAGLEVETLAGELRLVLAGVEHEHDELLEKVEKLAGLARAMLRPPGQTYR